MKKIIAAMLSLAMIMSMFTALPVYADDEVDAPGETQEYVEPESPSITYNMNVDWKFKKASGTVYPLASALPSVAKNGKQFYEVDYDDSDWEDVSVPHPINAIDTFDGACLDSGEQGLYRGFMFYRKHVTIPASDAGKKMFLEFEAVRQSVYLYVNGELVGFYEAGVAPIGFDISKYVKPGEDNVIAVATDNSASRGNSNDTRETRPGSKAGAADGNGYQWNTQDFNEVQGGITGNVNLYAKGEIYQTLPLYNNLKTTGNYIYGSNYDIDGKSATINVKAEIRNETDADANLTLQVDVVAMDGTLAFSFETEGTAEKATDPDAHFENMVPADAYEANPAPTDISTVDVSYITATSKMENMRFWSDKDPYLYTVYTILKDGDDVIDVSKTVTGFRKVDYDISSGGLKINDQSVYLRGYAQRATDEWAVVGTANDWLNDKDMELIRESNANHIRWMHVAPKPVTVRSSDKYGVVVVCPAGDKEGDVDGRSWDQRVEAMRDVMIYFRNSPSVLFWEGGNNQISADHIEELAQLSEELDPNGGRFTGSRTMPMTYDEDTSKRPAEEIEADHQYVLRQMRASSYVGTMLNKNAAWAKRFMAELNKYMPIMETEYARDEAPRRVWDDWSPPDYDYKNWWLNGANKEDGFDMWDHTSEDFARINAGAYNEFWAGRVGGGGDELYTGAAIMVWSDSNMHTRNTHSENCRTSGKVDPVRIPKEAFYALQAVQSIDEPKLHIIGHWNYPEYIKGDRENGNYWYEDRTLMNTGAKPHFEPNGTFLQREPVKTVYVIGSPDIKSVRLYINDEEIGYDPKPDNAFVYAFPNINVSGANGEIRAVGYDENDVAVTEDFIKTAGEPDHIEISPMHGPDGLVADGSDVMYFDVKIVDEDGNVCPLVYDRLDLKLIGNGVLLGGYNSGVGDLNTTNKVENNIGYTNAECGVNRIFVRSTREAGDIKLEVTCGTLNLMADRSITSVEFDNTVDGNEGLSTTMQRSYALGEQPEIIPEKVEAFKPLAAAVKADFSEDGNTMIVEETDNTVYYTVTVDGKEIGLEGELRARDGSGGQGVFGPLVPILKELKDAGVITGYTVSGGTGSDPVIVEFVTGTGVTYHVKQGLNGIYQDDPTVYTEIVEVPLVIGGELFANLTAVLGYIPGVMVSKDETNHICAITIAAPAQASVEEEYVLSSVDEDSIELMEIDPKYEEQVFKNDFNTDERTDSPDGTGYLSPTTGTKVFDGFGTTLQDDSLISFDFRFDTETGTMSIKNGALEGGKWGPNFSWSEGQFRTQTESSKWQPLGALTIGEWYSFEIEGTMAIASPSSVARLYKWVDGEKVLVQETVGFHLRQFGSASNGTADYMVVNAGISIDNVTITSLYASEIEVSSVADEINANDSVLLTSKALRGGKTIARATPVEWSLYNEAGEELEDESITIDENGRLATTSMAPNQTVIVRATATTNGNPYGEKAIIVHGLDTSNDKFDEITASCDTEYVRTGEPAKITTVCKMNGEVVEDEFADKNIAIITPDEDVTDAQLIYAIYNADTGALEQVKLAEEKFSAEAGEEVTIEIPFDIGTDVKIMLWKSLESMEPVNMTIDTNPDTSGIVWKVYNADKTREFTNIGIKINKGVVTIDKDVLPQTINVRASNLSGSSQAWITLNIKPGDMILDGELGNKDVYVTGNACEDIAGGSLSLMEGSWDGSGYYKANSNVDLPGFPSDNGDHVLYSADIRFEDGQGGWTIWNGSKGKQGLELSYSGGRVAIRQDSSKNPTYCEVDTTSWYNIQIMCATGVKPNSYANLIVYKYENGVKVHPETGEVGKPYVAEDIPMRNLDEHQANHMEIKANTCFDNVYFAKTTPDDIKISVDKNVMYAGQSIQGSVAAYRKGVKYGYISSDLIRWVVYDENNANPLGNDLIKVDASGKLTVDALAEAQTVYLRVQTLDGLLYDSAEITIQSSDIFTVKTIGFNEGYEKVVQLNVTKNFSYSDDVTFIVAVYDSDETTLKSITTRKMSAKSIERSEEPVAISMDAPMPDGFDKESDVVYVYTMTSNSENEAVTEDDGTIEAEFSGDSLTFTTLPEFDESSAVILMVVKPNTVTTSVKDEDVVYIKQFTGASLAELDTIKITDQATGDYIIKIAGKVDGMSVINTGVVTK